MNNKIILRCSTDGMVNIPKEIYKELGWKLNENLTIDIIKNGMVHNITITKDETDYDNR